MNFPLEIFKNILFGVALIDERVRRTKFIPVINLIFLLLLQNVR
jgi:hypothetical protein